MLARCLGILVVSCAVGWQLGCGSATTDDDPDDGTTDVPEVPDETSPDETSPDVPDADEDGGGCAPGTTDCSGVCVDLASDPEHCGSCEVACDDGLNATAVCESTHCELRCEAGWVDLDGERGCEARCTPSPDGIEECNGADDDCNGMIDDGFDCSLGQTDSCVTSCGSTGEHFCGSGCVWQECIPPDETCDGTDQDCDGVADDGVYGKVWAADLLVAEATGETRPLSFSIAVVGGEIGVGHVLATGAAATAGQARMRRLRLDGTDFPVAVATLGAGSSSQMIAAAGAGSIATFLWSTSDGAALRGESVFIQSAVLGSSYLLGPFAAVDSSDEEPSSAPAVARSGTADVAYAAWVEVVAGVPRVEISSVENRASPAVGSNINIGSGVNPRAPSIALHGDATVLVAWSSGSPGDIRAQRLNTGLSLLGEVINVTSGGAASDRPRVAASADRFMVVWEEGAGVMLATIDPAGVVPPASTMLAAADARAPVIVADLAGGFAVAYQTSAGVDLLRLDAEGVSGSAPLHFEDAERPELAFIPGGGLIVGYMRTGSVYVSRVGCRP